MAGAGDPDKSNPEERACLGAQAVDLPNGAYSELRVAAFRNLHPCRNWPSENNPALELAVHHTDHCTAQRLSWPVTGSPSGVSTPEYCSPPPPEKVCHSVVLFDRSFKALLRDMSASCPTHNFR